MSFFGFSEDLLQRVDFLSISWMTLLLFLSHSCQDHWLMLQLLPITNSNKPLDSKCLGFQFIFPLIHFLFTLCCSLTKYCACAECMQHMDRGVCVGRMTLWKAFCQRVPNAGDAVTGWAPERGAAKLSAQQLNAVSVPAWEHWGRGIAFVPWVSSSIGSTLQRFSWGSVPCLYACMLGTRGGLWVFPLLFLALLLDVSSCSV